MSIDVYIPSNISDFKCQMCGDCCRRKWDIVMTKAEYESIRGKYEKKGKLEIFEKAFIITNKETPDNYAKLVHDGDKCILLTENNLCSKQLELGAEALTNTCFNYPKKTMLTPRGREISMYYSCPTAVKTLDTDIPITIVKNPENFSFRYEVKQKVNIDKNLMDFYFLLEEFLLKVMQNRKLSIQERLLVLAYIALNTQNLNISYQALPSIINIFEKAQKIIEHKELLEKLDNIEPNLHYQVSYILGTINNRENRGLLLIKSEIEKINEIFGIKSGEGNINQIVEKFLGEYSKRYEPYENQYNNIIENYLCQFIFRRDFGNGFINGLYVTSLFYVSLRFFAICMCIEKNEVLNKEILLETIRIIEYGLAHNIYIYEAIQNQEKEKKNDISTIISIFKL